MNTTETEVMQAALAKAIECDADDLTEDGAHYGRLALFTLGTQEYAIGTDDEANEAASTSIADSLWAFTASFLSDCTGLPAEMFAAIADKCEDSNDAVRKTVDATCGLEDFAEAAISADGRGHFLSTYDGNEIEVEHEGVLYFVYRVN